MKQRLRDLEARELWIEARVDELLDDYEWTKSCLDWNYSFEADDSENPVLPSEFLRVKARQQATREHASIIADLEESIIDSMELK